MEYLNTILIVVGLAIIIWLIIKNQKPTEVKDDKAMLMLQQQLGDLTQHLGEKIDKTTQHSSKMLQDQFMETSRISKDMTEKLLKLEETNKQVIGFTDQLQNLEKVLTNSKNRGALGEASLELILSNILPPQSYQTQYHFKNGEAVDAVVKIKDKILPVDAKFSLENYRRILGENDKDKKAILEKEFKNDLKKRIDETSKYIRPNEDTLDFAFMFIPAEGIYYDLLINEVGAVKVNTRSLIDYAFNEKKVIIVSPTTFAAYLQTVLQGLKALQIEESAKEIRQNVEKLQKHLAAYGEYHQKLGNQLSTVANTYNFSNKEFKKIDKDILKVSGKESALELEDVDKPRLE
ncbi:MAG: DNA recombination protein RmuC [Candidatus Komeilibacteria bacterium CG11_big_fil_rev_8_21_14_0_20_36_20]|uniref:DNA recombination protein RmuC n=1 Tax=Candidatus Komeilibacteria bacterium CG11_big_fil_rev_8_21_14_0_20_36_20 TaxID=1974477 RepID=A0A2H0NDZ5_9BACT|nr:MAG: DNA recombination protein RmuC [Candidatus Komeilibacteria bacterium CG11_big_fil_rev_8_21_14_0_20_36_20]PIR81240.1 MAG: DNA recombination protein RmuC [Candidatus Komeilibacteria bacterium CG10_big_fil_rev_8_21_14_0_10_36_65]PJC55204.1 MAG: DNA recombination protein RmuC [Candidatus Komeilibacteria bacterium CG_4_9_14_0_2_um_filter_36_13]